jgi:hypothetical protein
MRSYEVVVNIDPKRGTRLPKMDKQESKYMVTPLFKQQKGQVAKGTEKKPLSPKSRPMFSPKRIMQ